MVYFRIQFERGQRVCSLAISLSNPSVFDFTHRAEEGMGGREGGGRGEGGGRRGEGGGKLVPCMYCEGGGGGRREEEGGGGRRG